MGEHINGGVNAQTSTSAGVGVEVTLAGPNAQALFGLNIESQSIFNFARQSDTHYLFELNFQYDFSTSSDPNLAGHASDVIVGGGLDIIASNALEGSVKSCFYD